MNRSERDVSPARDDAPSYRAAGVAGVIVLLLYVRTLAPTTALWDASEYITAAYILGIPHPPGNPLFILLGRVATLVPLGGVAARVNMLAAVCSAGTAAVWFLVAERVVVSWIHDKRVRLAIAGGAALLSATAFTVWNQSVVNEKVYTISLAFFAAVSWLTVRWCDDPDGPRADRLLVLIAYLIGLGYTNHPAGFLVGPAVAVAVVARRPRTTLRWRLLLAGALAFTLGLTPFAVEPIRAAYHPALNEGEPTGCTERIGVMCTFSETTRARLMANINRDQYGKPALSERQAPFTAQVGMWWLYFRWQWLRDAHDTQPLAQLALAVLFLALGIAGGVLHWRHDRASFWFFGPLIGTVTIALVYYMNFKYGASQAPGVPDLPREVRDRDYFYLWSYSAWSVWAAIGLGGAWRVLAHRLSPGRAPRWSTTAPVLAIAAVPLIGNWRDASRAGETAPREWAHDLLNSVEPYGILITLGDNDTFPLWYAQEVEGVRRDVTVAVTSLLNTDWYPRALARRPVARYDAPRGPAIYRALPSTPPSSPLFSLSTEQLDAVPQMLDVRGPQVFQHGTLRAVVDPRKLEYGVPIRSDLLVLQLLRDNLGRRPFYIARSTGAYTQALGLSPYALGQGLVTRIMPSAVQGGRDTVRVSDQSFLDVSRSLALWRSYGAPSAIVARGDWVDRPSLGVPLGYVSASLLLADALDVTGKPALADSIRRSGLRIAEGTRTLDLFLAPPAPRGAPAPPQPAP